MPAERLECDGYPPGATPCCRCMWLYGEKPQRFGQKWSECYAATYRRPQRTCRYFLDVEDKDAVARARGREQ